MVNHQQSHTKCTHSRVVDQKKFVTYDQKVIWLSSFVFFAIAGRPKEKKLKNQKKTKEKQKKRKQRKRERAMALLVSYSTLACFSSLSTSSSMSSSSSPYSILPITTNPGEIISTRCSSLLFSFLFYLLPLYTSPSRNTKRPIDTLSLYLYNNPKQTELTF